MQSTIEPIAIIGVAGRFPGAADTGQLWRNLLAEEEGIRFPSDDDLLSRGVSRAALDDSAYVRAVAEPDDLDRLDAAFFGLTRREAEMCDPQLRLFLETSHSAVENAGYDPAGLGRTGVFASVAANRYAALAPADLRSATAMATGMWNNPESASTLVSYKLNLHGPSMTVQTACSSSLVSVHLAVNALRLAECDVALAGGADVEFPLGHGYCWAQDGPLSRDGRCRPFDASAGGTVFGSGAGVIVLKRLSDALADGDHIYAVVRSVAVNNDGSDKVGFTAPSARGQAEVVRRAMDQAGVRAEDIGYVEAHATGTRLGDPIELAALTEAFESRTTAGLPAQGCPVGSVKGNVGHLGHAAGITSLIKVALSLDAETIPASINVTDVNPLLDLANTPFTVATGARPWPRTVDRRRVAGVSSFGIGGTNSHAILEEAPPRVPGTTPGGPHVVVWSARTVSAADAYRDRLAAYAEGSAAPLADVAATLQTGRTAYACRGAVVADDLRDAAAALRDPDRLMVTPDADDAPGSVVFLFPGQGAQHPRMAWDLYATETLFREPFDECLDLFAAQGLPILQRWRDETANLDETIVAQPLLFSVEYAMARMWLGHGIEPDALLGHSVGEFAAAALAGVFTLPDAVTLVAARARAMSESPPGAMLAVAADVDTVTPLLSGSLEVAVVNSDRQTVIAGSVADVERFAAGTALRCTRLKSPHAFHTAAMRDASERFRAAFDTVEAQRPRRKLYSAAAGGPVGALQVWDPDFWVRQVAEPVWYARAFDALLADADRVLLEAGPGRTLTQLAQAHARVRAGRHVVVSGSVHHGLARLWTLGKDVRWPAASRRVPLPGYPYERERFWVAPREPETLFRLPAWTEGGPAEPVQAPKQPLVFLAIDDHRFRTLLSELGLDAAPAGGFDRLVARLQEVTRNAPDRRAPDLLVLTGHSADVTGGETVDPERAMLHGLIRTYALENPHATAKLIDVGPAVPDVLLAAELSDTRSGIVALRGDRRWLPGDRPYEPGDEQVRLRRNGVYVITGGLGGLGLAVAQGLAATGSEPRLVLLGRHVRPEHEDAVEKIRTLGAQCEAEPCDVTDPDALRRVLDGVTERFGPVNGILHLAGVPGGGMLQFRTQEQMAATLAPKVHGTLALVEAFRDRPAPDFFVAFSSRAALTGLVGSADYAAGNAFLDAVMRAAPLPGCHTMSINWPSWASVGMAARQAARPRADAAAPAPGSRRWSTTLSVDTYPILDEHRLDGVPVLPGTAQVDCVLRGFHAEVPHDGSRPVQLRNIVFREPITASEPITLEVVFEPHDDRWRFRVRSAPLSPEAGFAVHTTGEIGPVDATPGEVDVDALRTELPERRTPLNESVGRLFTIGPRWPHEEVCFAPEVTDRRLVALRFAAEFTHELAEYALHPTLLDAAVSSARDSDRELPHAPFGYESIVVHQPVPAFAYSYVRRRPSGTDTIVADIDVLTPAGEVAVAVQGFTMRRVDESMVAAPSEHGIDPEDGVDMLLRLLARPGLRQVAVTLPGEDAVQKPAPKKPAAVTPVRTATDGTVEHRLMTMWSTAFGVPQVGPDDDFFDLGGDSLTAVGLMDEIRREFGLEVGIAAIFDHRTVTALAAEVSRLRG